MDDLSVKTYREVGEVKATVESINARFDRHETYTKETMDQITKLLNKQDGRIGKLENDVRPFNRARAAGWTALVAALSAWATQAMARFFN